MRRTRFIIPAMLAVAALLATGCGGGGGGGGAAWCAHLDDVVDRGWREYDTNPGNTAVSRFNDLRDMDPTDPDFRWADDLTEAELDELAEAFDDAIGAGNRYDGRAAVRAWEDSLRDACPAEAASETAAASEVAAASEAAAGSETAAASEVAAALEAAADEYDRSDPTAAASLSDAATEIASDLTDAAAHVGDSNLPGKASLADIAREVTDAARRLASVAEPDYDDLGDVDETM